MTRIAAPATATRMPGAAGAIRQPTRTTDETADPERCRRRVDLTEAAGEIADVVDEPPSGRRDAEEPRELVGDHDERDPGEVPEPHRLREQVGEEAEPSDRPDEQEAADDEREQPGDGDALGRVGAGDGDHGGGDERRERRVRAEDEDPRRPEDGVGEERNDGRVQAGDGREPRQLRVRHPLRDEQRREHEARDDVAAQPLPAVGAGDPDPGDERPRAARVAGRRSRRQPSSSRASRCACPGSACLRELAYDARASATSSSRSRIAAWSSPMSSRRGSAASDSSPKTRSKSVVTR